MAWPGPAWPVQARPGPAWAGAGPPQADPGWPMSSWPGWAEPDWPWLVAIIITAGDIMEADKPERPSGPCHHHEMRKRTDGSDASYAPRFEHRYSRLRLCQPIYLTMWEQCLDTSGYQCRHGMVCCLPKSNRKLIGFCERGITSHANGPRTEALYVHIMTNRSHMRACACLPYSVRHEVYGMSR